MTYWLCIYFTICDDLTIFNEAACLTIKSIFNTALIFLKARMWKHAWICSWNQPVLSNKGKGNNGRLWWDSNLQLNDYESDVKPTAPQVSKGGKKLLLSYHPDTSGFGCRRGANFNICPAIFLFFTILYNEQDESRFWPFLCHVTSWSKNISRKYKYREIAFAN